jgi:hypothetical protein
MNQIKRNDIIPFAHQQMLKLDGVLGAYTPALTAARAFGHIVFERSLTVAILKTQCRRRAILTAGQTSIALFINPEVRHKYYPIYYLNIYNNLLYINSNIDTKAFRAFFTRELSPAAKAPLKPKSSACRGCRSYKADVVPL